jgi:transcriptional regulator with XRE-family HTH domain
MSNRESQRSARQIELGIFLRAARAQLRPADVGLPKDHDPGLRRAPGLRREEVARLSGVGVTWYTWLEQGRNIVASEQVIDALARALQLDPDQRRHLRRLAGLSFPTGQTDVDDALPRLQRLVDATAPNVACIFDLHFDYVVWNTPYIQLRHDPAKLPDTRRNLLWTLFSGPENQVRETNSGSAARAVLSQFRTTASQRPHDARFTTIVTELSQASPLFRRWWAEYPVASFKPATVKHDHPELGSIDLEIFHLRPAEHPDLLLVIQVPVSNAFIRQV